MEPFTVDAFKTPDELWTLLPGTESWSAPGNWSPTPSRSPARHHPYRCRFNEDFKYVLLPLFYWLWFALGAPLNGATLWLFLRRRGRWNFYYRCAFNLIVSDTLYTLSLPLLGVYYALGNHWPFGGVLCSAARFMFYFNMYTSVGFLACISAHRYLKVRCGGRADLGRIESRLLSSDSARWVCAAVWLGVLVQTAPILWFTSTTATSVASRASTGKIVCPDTTTRERFQSFLTYSYVTSVTLFALPLCSIVASYCAIVSRLRTAAVRRLGDRFAAFRMRTTRLILAVVLVFAVCFVPFHLTRAMYYALRGSDAVPCAVLDAVNTSYKVMRPLASANCCLDPVLFIFLSKKIRREFLASVRFTKNVAQMQAPQGVMELESVPV